ncbi:MAG TPA: glucose-6-phosphate isomerase, partial [Alphaproteobacteria bacterium]|nr:glucose-6-phosphate isomerase [Alphaproteobacteria bacterium]
MPNNPQSRDTLPAWQALARHKTALSDVTLHSLFAENPARDFALSHEGLHFDFSRHAVTEETLDLLVGLAQDCDLEAERESLFTGGLVNATENRAALHTALRGGKDAPHADEIASTLARIKDISDSIRTDKTIKTVVVIGIGGSDCGPHLVCEAMKPIANGPDIRFLSNIDPGHVAETLKGLSPASTCFIISSKSFSTQETMANAAYAKSWAGGAEKFIALTGNKKAALEFGIDEKNILPVPDWVGGRYSLWSAVGLPIAVTAGFENFRKLLDGAASADKHFRTAPLRQNIPAMMALLSVWQRNFEGRPAFAVLPYDQRLSLLPRYVQQLSMESNG